MPSEILANAVKTTRSPLGNAAREVNLKFRAGGDHNREKREKKEGCSLSQSPAKSNLSILLPLLELEHDSAVITKIVLVVVACGKVITEPRQHIINLRDPDRDAGVQDDIETPANYEIGRIVARGQGAGANTRVHTKVVENIAVSIGVGAAA